MLFSSPPSPSPHSSSPLPPESYEMRPLTLDAHRVLGPNQPGPAEPRRYEASRFLEVHANQQQFTTRAVAVGLLVGTVVNFSNMYFGLQTGWVSMMSMPSTLIGFAIFKAFAKHLKLPFTPVENVLVQTVAVAVGSMPLSAGFVGVIPALENLLKPEEGGPLHLSMPKLIFWSMGIAFFGVFFAVPLRKQVIIREKLKFPSGTATALMISVLHGNKHGNRTSQGEEVEHSPEVTVEDEETQARSWKEKTRLLGYSFAVSGAYTLASYFLPILRDLPIFGSSIAKTWLWTLNPSPAYVGQGIIMGTSTTLHMLLGAIVGWGILSPLAHNKGWAPGAVSDWVKGSRGWIVWISLAIMLSDSVVSLGGLVIEPVIRWVFALRKGTDRGSYQRLLHQDGDGDGGVRTGSYEAVGRGSEEGLRRRGLSIKTMQDEEMPEEDAPEEHLVPMKVVYGGLAVSGVLCIGAVKTVFPQVPFLSTLVAFFLALILSVMGVRALGQTDLNPVSGISKITQLVFALITPRSSPSAVLINLVAGGISEAGALQAGDIMQDLKTGHLIGAAPRAQFYGQLVGSVFGAIISAGVYRLYTSVYPVPGELFQVPTAFVWIDCSRLVFGEGLPEYAWEFACAFAVVFSLATVARGWVVKGAQKDWIPGGIAVAVGMYNVPSFTLARVVGGLVTWWWNKGREDRGERETMLVILASGLILGEGIMSIVNLGLASLGVPHW